MTYVLAVGDAFGGITVYGPYETQDEAIEVGQTGFDEVGDWHVVALEQPAWMPPQLDADIAQAFRDEEGDG